MQGRRRAVLLLLAGAYAGYRCRGALLKLVTRITGRWQYDGLEGIVSYSSRVIAASRALEHERPDRFFEDPLAAVLAGPKALQAARARSSQAAPSIDLVSGARRLPRIVVRTRFFDDALLAALGARCRNGLYSALVQALPAPCAQLVLLGSGMDSRPWRLDLPPGVAWFELDQADVLGAKTRALQRHGAQVQRGQAGMRCAHPLRVASWTTVAADLQQAGWARRLQEAGLDARKPICWVAEGLLYYLQPDAVPQILEEAAGVSPPGSVFMASVITLESLAWMQQQRQRRQQEGAGRVGAAEASLTSKFVWGCPGDVGEYFGCCGWRVLMSPGWTSVPQHYGCQADFQTGDASRAPPSSLQYTVCIKAQ